MTVYLIEGFEGSPTTADYYSGKHPRMSSGWSCNATGRWGGTDRYMKMGGGGSSASMTFDLSDVNPSTILCGWAGGIFEGGNDTFDLFRLRDGTTNQIYMTWNASGYFQLRHGSGTEFARFYQPLSTWYYHEIKAVIDNTTGSLQWRVNGADIYNQTNIDTQNTANAYITQVYYYGFQSEGSFWDDLYIADSGSLWGDIRVQCIVPNGNGNSSQWVGQDADSTDNYLNVDEAPGSNPDDDTTYNESSTVGNKDTYACQDLAFSSGTIHAVQPSLFARKTDTATRQVCTVARLSGGTEEDGPTQSLATGYQYWADIRTTKPGGGAWTVSDVNNGEFGMKVIA